MVFNRSRPPDVMGSVEGATISRRCAGVWLSWLSVPGWQTIREVHERSARLLEALAHGPEPVNHEEQQYDLGQEDHDLEGLDQQLNFPVVHCSLRSVLGATAEAARGALRRTVSGSPDARGQAG